MTNEGAERLAAAIIKSVADDYERALKSLRRNPDGTTGRGRVADSEKFFRGDWFKLLCCEAVDGEEIIRRMQSRVLMDTPIKNVIKTFNRRKYLQGSEGASQALEALHSKLDGAFGRNNYHLRFKDKGGGILRVELIFWGNNGRGGWDCSWRAFQSKRGDENAGQ